MDNIQSSNHVQKKEKEIGTGKHIWRNNVQKNLPNLVKGTNFKIDRVLCASNKTNSKEKWNENGKDISVKKN